MLPKEILAQAATIARGLALDAVHASQSGHLGLPLGCAEIGRRALRARAQPLSGAPRVAQSRSLRALGRPRLDVPLLVAAPERLPRHDARRRSSASGSSHSKTPGHPELTHAPSGVETTTGPLGQGVANAVGMAVAAKMAEARFNTKEHDDLRSPHRLPRRRRVHARGRGDGGGGVRRPPAARQPDPHLRLERRHARRDGEGDAERGHREALRGHRLRRADRRRARDGRVLSRRSSARRTRGAASRSSSSPRRSSARASPRSRARRRRTARPARSSPTPRARASACPRSRTTSRPR